MQCKDSKDAEMKLMMKFDHSFINRGNCVLRNDIYPPYITICCTEMLNTWPSFLERINVA
jgi:hypothetical protein